MAALPLTKDFAQQLQTFIKLCQTQPSVLHHPDLNFFKTYIESMGGKVLDQSRDAAERNYRDPCGLSQLPPDIVKQLYEFLPEGNDAKVDFVFETWKSLREDPGVFRRAPLVISSFDDITDLTHKLKNFPVLYRVVGEYDSGEEFINELLNNVENLRKMNVSFNKPISATDIFKLTQKYPDLESVTIDFAAPDILASLKILSNCPKLNELVIEYTGDYLDPIHTKFLFTYLADHFQSLKKLDLLEFHVEERNDAIVDLLARKMNQLVSLKCSVEDYETSSPSYKILETILKCTSLENLELTMYYRLSMNFGNLNHLKSLHLYCLAMCEINFGLLPNLETLKINFSCKFHCNSDIINKVINSLPKLKRFEASCIADSDINEQLKNIGTLQNLQTLILINCKYLSVAGLTHISKCQQLRCLGVSKVLMTEAVLQSISKCIYLEKLILYECFLNTRLFVPFVLSLKYVTNIYLYKCYQVSGRNKSILMDEEVEKQLTEEFRCQNCLVNVMCEVNMDNYGNSYINDNCDTTEEFV